MDDVVAVRVNVSGGSAHYFLTWGRLIDTTDPVPLAHLVLRETRRFQLSGKPMSAAVCRSMQEAAACEWFYEGFSAICRQSIPFGATYAAWRREKLDRQLRGQDIWHAGSSETPGPAADQAQVDDGYEMPMFRHDPPSKLEGLEGVVSTAVVPWCCDELQCHHWEWDGATWAPTSRHSENEVCSHSGHDLVGSRHMVCPTCGWTFEIEPDDESDT